jgi:hypothetical protein
MSVAQIIEELPKLSDGERAAVWRRLQELDAADEEVRFLDSMMLAGMAELDRREAAHDQAPS